MKGSEDVCSGIGEKKMQQEKFRSMKRDVENLDEFWEIAFWDDGAPSLAVWNGRSGLHLNSDGDDDGDDNIDATIVQGPKRYRFPNTDVDLLLAPLPAIDGIWSPVGADAWYSSALLSTLLILQPSEDDVEIEFPTNKDALVVLELGSGAVGLSGLACAVGLGQRYSKAKVVLTDNDSAVLDQLRINVDQNLRYLPSDVQLDVQFLDWNDYSEFFSSQSLSSTSIDMVIGSELVYTEETATSCSNLLLYLLKQYPEIVILIVQVTDRFGWNEIVIPRLEARRAKIQRLPLSAITHSLASSMIMQGGTLDAFAYGAFLIRNKKEVSAC